MRVFKGESDMMESAFVQVGGAAGDTPPNGPRLRLFGSCRTTDMAMLLRSVACFIEPPEREPVIIYRGDAV